MSAFVNYNGNFLPSDQPLVSADNRGLRYGDGIFETMRMVKGRIPLWDLHLDRLMNGLKQMKFEIFGTDFFEQIERLSEKNSTSESGRIRLTVFRGDGGLYDPENHIPNFVIQSWSIDQFPSSINEEGLVIDCFPDIRKSCDAYSHLKSNNFLPYVVAALFAKENKLNDCLVLNSNDRISDSTIANIFSVKNEVISTPPLSEGCVAGVMRRWLLEKAGLDIVEEPLGIDQLLDADEVFLTNSVFGIRWVKQFRNKEYTNKTSSALYQILVKVLFS